MLKSTKVYSERNMNNSYSSIGNFTINQMIFLERFAINTKHSAKYVMSRWIEHNMLFMKNNHFYMIENVRRLNSNDNIRCKPKFVDTFLKSTDRLCKKKGYICQQNTK